MSDAAATRRSFSLTLVDTCNPSRVAFGLVRAAFDTSGWRTLAAVLALACGSLSVRNAHGAGEEPEALIRQGIELRRSGNTSRALGYFKRAYNLAHTPRSAAQLGLCELALKTYVDGEAHLSEALAAHNPWVEENRGTLEKTRSDARGHLGQVDVSGTPAGAVVTVDGRAVGSLPSVTTWAAPGDSSMTASATGYVAVTRAVKVTAGGHVTEQVDLQPIAPVTPAIALSSGAGAGEATGSNAPTLVSQPDTAGGTTAEASPPIYRRWWFWTAIGAAVIAGTAGVFIATHSGSAPPACNVSPCTVWQ